jgi:hypothetical protein
MAQKVFIFLEFTKDRIPCEEMVDILRKSGQQKSADELENFNRSPSPWILSLDTELEVTKSQTLRSGSKWFHMESMPRGKCIIINNLLNNGNMDSLRFNSVFKQLGFDVEYENCYNMSAEKIMKRLSDLSKEDRLKDDDALIVMIISHGQEEEILEYSESSKPYVLHSQ